MEIKLLISRAGVGFSQNAGDTIEVSEDEALRMIEAGQAEFIDLDDDGDVDRYDKAAALGIAIVDDEGNKLHWKTIDKLIEAKQA